MKKFALSLPFSLSGKNRAEIGFLSPYEHASVSFVRLNLALENTSDLGFLLFLSNDFELRTKLLHVLTIVDTEPCELPYKIKEISNPLSYLRNTLIPYLSTQTLYGSGVEELRAKLTITPPACQ